MDSTFGNTVLTLFQIIDGKTLSYGYSNMPMREDLRQLQIKFRNSLVSYLDNSFGKNFVKDKNDVNYNRRVKFLGLSSIKNKFEHKRGFITV